MFRAVPTFRTIQPITTSVRIVFRSIRPTRMLEDKIGSNIKGSHSSSKSALSTCRTNRQAFTKQTKRRQKNRGADRPADAVTAVSIAGPAPAAPPVANTEGSQSMVEGFLSVWLSLPGGGEIELKCYFFFLKSFDIFQ